MQKTPSGRHWFRLGATVLAGLYTAIATAQSFLDFTIAEIFSNPRYYQLSVAILVLMLIWWIHEKNTEIRELRDSHPNIVNVEDDRIDFVAGTGPDVERYGPRSSFSRF